MAEPTSTINTFRDEACRGNCVSVFVTDRDLHDPSFDFDEFIQKVVDELKAIKEH